MVNRSNLYKLISIIVISLLISSSFLSPAYASSSPVVYLNQFPEFNELFHILAVASGVCGSAVLVTELYNRWAHNTFTEFNSQPLLDAIDDAKIVINNFKTTGKILLNTIYDNNVLTQMANFVKGINTAVFKNTILKKLGFDYTDSLSSQMIQDSGDITQMSWLQASDPIGMRWYFPANGDVVYSRSEDGLIISGLQLLQSSFPGQDIVIMGDNFHGPQSMDHIGYFYSGNNPFLSTLQAPTSRDGKVFISEAGLRKLVSDTVNAFLENLFGLSPGTIYARGTDFSGPFTTFLSSYGLDIEDFLNTQYASVIDKFWADINWANITGDLSKDYKSLYDSPLIQSYFDSFSSQISYIDNILQQIKDNTEEIKAQIPNALSQAKTEVITQIQVIASEVSSMSGKVDTMSGKVDTMSGKVDTMSSKVDTMSSKVDTVTEKVTTMDETLQEVKNEAQEGTGFLETIKDTAVSIKDFLLNLGEVIGNVLSDLFVPSEEALDFSGVKAILLEKFPFDLFSQISDTFDVSLPSEGLSYNLDVFGSTMTLDFASFSSYFPFSLRSVVLAVFYLTLIVSVLRMLIPGLKI